MQMPSGAVITDSIIKSHLFEHIPPAQAKRELRKKCRMKDQYGEFSSNQMYLLVAAILLLIRLCFAAQEKKKTKNKIYLLVDLRSHSWSIVSWFIETFPQSQPKLHSIQILMTIIITKGFSLSIHILKFILKKFRKSSKILIISPVKKRLLVLFSQPWGRQHGANSGATWAEANIHQQLFINWKKKNIINIYIYRLCKRAV